MTESFLTVLLFLLLAIWVGGMFGFGALYAPVLFREVASRDQAGQIAGQTLARIDTLGLIAGGVVTLIALLQAFATAAPLDVVRVVIALGMVVLVGYSTAVVRSRLNAIRAEMGKPIDQFEETDPKRVEYNRYHKLSTRIYGIVLFLGIALIVLSALRVG
ncbi:MAG TPA: DUF4149 domain-containing protein [Symbiobacteriaceae bacterium]|nr:DUF4149 domain-containing protein [Symbiobacteriaceae bacterium]